jgi:hypothetical protein
LFVSLVLGAGFAGLLGYVSLRNGTHAHYCPADSAVWVFRCLPSWTGIGLAIGYTLVVGVVTFPLVWLLFRAFGIK